MAYRCAISTGSPRGLVATIKILVQLSSDLSISISLGFYFHPSLLPFHPLSSRGRSISSSPPSCRPRYLERAAIPVRFSGEAEPKSCLGNPLERVLLGPKAWCGSQSENWLRNFNEPVLQVPEHIVVGKWEEVVKLGSHSFPKITSWVWTSQCLVL